MTTVTLKEAQEHLPELVEAAERGEQVVIDAGSVNVALVVREKASAVEEPPRRRKLGTMAGTVIINDPDWDKPMDIEDMRREFGDEFVREYYNE